MRARKPETIKAKDLMNKDFSSIQSDRSLQEALELLAGKTESLSLLVRDSAGEPLACLSAENLITHLLEGTIDTLEAGELPGDLPSRLSRRVADLPLEPLVCLKPEDSLALMLLRSREGGSEWLPVCEGKRVLGLVALNELYLAAASLTLAGEADELPFLNKGQGQ